MPFQGHIPLSLIPVKGGYMVRERGMPPERIKGSPLGTMVGGSPLHNAIVMLMMLFPRRPLSSYTGRIDSAGSEEKSAGG